MSPLASVVTWHSASLGDPVWAPCGHGYRAAEISGIRRKHAFVIFDTGAREKHPYSALRRRRPELSGADLPPRAQERAA